MGSGHASVVPYQALPTKDGFLVVAVFAEKFWAGFCRAIERPELETDPRFESNARRVENKAALVPLLEATFPARTVEQWLDALRREGVPAAPINAIDQVLADPQVRHRQMVVETAHPALGALPAIGTPIKVDGAMGLEVRPAPALGEHTDEVLTTLAGYSKERLAGLRRERAIA
jgi:formyl-CoA transferase/CoA:oxalate CoA-transferase